MMAICSDLDETPDRNVYLAIAKFLNTTDDTCMGPGVGLEVGNSIFFEMPRNQFSYWGTDDQGREMVRALIRSGHIDCLHSYGDLAIRREHAARAIEELERHGCRLGVWVDHSKSPSNFGPDIMFGQGDMLGADAYHADLSMRYGIRYVWRGRTTGLLGQDAPLDRHALAGVFEPRHALVATRTIAKEVVKVLLGRMKCARWQMHGANTVLRRTTLRDGRPVWEFMRADPFWGGQSRADTASGISKVLHRKTLDFLVSRRAVWILYTHLGKVTDPRVPFEQPTRDAFRLLKTYHDSGAVLVTTTYRLLQYLTVRDCLKYRAVRTGGKLTIAIDSVADPIGGPRSPSLDEVRGITFETPRTSEITVRLPKGADVLCSTTHLAGKTFSSIPWTPLAFPQL
jgi:hypothetical protein